MGKILRMVLLEVTYDDKDTDVQGLMDSIVANIDAVHEVRDGTKHYINLRR